jgi:outer membrane protein
MTRTAAASVLFIGLCSSVTHASAQQPGQDEPEGTIWGLGIGAISTQKPYTGIDRETKALPLIHFENRYVRVFGPGVEVKLPSLSLAGSHKLDFRVVGKYDGSGYEASDAPILAGMDKRRGGFWAGAKMEWQNDIAELSAEWLADASSHSKGQRFSLVLEKNWHLGQSVMLTPRIGARWMDKKYVDYYYGVRDSEAMAGRPAYLGKAGVNAELGVRAMYRLDQHQSLMLDVGVTGLAKEIKDSPLVNRSNENRVMLGYMYRF